MVMLACTINKAYESIFKHVLVTVVVLVIVCIKVTINKKFLYDYLYQI